MTDYIETYRKIPVDKIVEFEDTPGFGPWKELFTKDSTRHPAKMNLNMLRFLIDNFTKPGDVILDSMAGTGSTGSMANILGRNAILVEYEEKFADMCRDNIELIKKNPGLHKGSTVVIQGDARELSSILKEKVDFAMFSPPYASQWGVSDKNTAKASFEREKRYLEAHPELKKVRPPLPGAYSSNPDNIGNKPYGDVDAVVTSPPHGNIDVTKSTCLKSEECPKKLPAKDIDRDGYSKDAENIGNKEYGDIGAIITSPPHGDAFKHSKQDPEKRLEKLIEVEKESVRKGQKWAMSSEKVLRKRLAQQDDGYSETPDNLGNLPYGKVDQVITSPPYSKANKGGGIAVKGYEGKHGKDEELQDRHERRLTEDDDNISNLPHGNIDSVITSPPYEQSRPWKAKKYKKFVEEMRRRIKDGEAKGHYSTPEAELRYVRKMQEGSQMTEGNIGLLSHKKVDTVLTSPPHANRLSDTKIHDDDKGRMSYRQAGAEKQDNIGTFKNKTYLQAMLSVYSESYAVLKPGGLMIIIVKNFVRNWKPIRLDTDTIKLCEHIGFDLAEHLYRRLKQKSFWIRNYETKFRKKFPDPTVPLPTAQFEDILVFKKPYEISGSPHAHWSQPSRTGAPLPSSPYRGTTADDDIARSTEITTDPLTDWLSGHGDDLVGFMDTHYAKSIEEVLKQVPIMENQVGIVIFDHKGILGLESFDSPKSWDALHKDIAKKYGETLAEQEKEALFDLKPEIIPKQISQFIKRMEEAASKETTVAQGERFATFHIEGEDLVGEYTMFDGEIIHVLAMRNT